MKRLVPLLLLLGCGELTAPANSMPYSPPEAYAALWQADLDCAGLGGSPTAWLAIQWFQVTPDATGRLDCGGVPAYACWIPRHHVYILSPQLSNAYVIRHEMLHDLLNDPSHNNPAWVTCHLL